VGQSQTALETELMGVLQKHPQIDLAILFGSHAAGRALPTSDLDLAVAANHQLGAREKMALIDDLALAAQCPVDLIDLTAVSGPILQQALTKGRLLLNRQPALLAKLTLKMWYNQADFMPDYNMILRKRAEAFAHG
jgi:predicted nucleotidyltransferase